MTLIKSISGFRGTIGGKAGDNLTPQDIVECTAAFGEWIVEKTGKKIMVIGRDGRISGELVSQLVVATLRSLGISVIDLGLSTTPTVEVAVPLEQAGGGIILTASHNPREWNALKLLNDKGEFISGQDGQEVLEKVAIGNIQYASVDKLGEYRVAGGYIARHIGLILGLDLVDQELVRSKNYKIVVDTINSTGVLAVPPLLEALGCEVEVINGECNGQFAHNPEPLKLNLSQLADEVKQKGANLGIAVDPDVDRLVFMNEDGELFGEEYTLVAVADYVLSQKPGNTVSNLSSSRALADVTRKHGGEYQASAVGEVHVVKKMKEIGAEIGGEGNGGIIYAPLHYGRDALVGIALFLTHLAKENKKMSVLRKKYPDYRMYKSKIQRSPEINLERIFEQLTHKYRNENINTVDGLKIDFDNGWVHLRPSNTEPIIRIYAESHSEVIAENLARKIMSDIQEIGSETES